jgi:hypothetical protein
MEENQTAMYFLRSRLFRYGIMKIFNRNYYIRKSACACAKLFVDEENVRCAKIESWKNINIDGFYTKTTQKGGFSKPKGKSKLISI